MTALVEAEEEGQAFGPGELYATCIVVLFASFETALNLIGNGLYALLRQPDKLRELRENPRLGPTAVEELLRYDSPLQLVGRKATETFEMGGKRIEQGQKVLVMLGSANRDGDQFPEPDRLDLRRRPNKHVAFSHGIHYCPGAALSRVAGEIAFETILRRLPHLELASEELEWQLNMSFRGLKRLPVTFG
jgi:cytochrome P450